MLMLQSEVRHFDSNDSRMPERVLLKEDAGPRSNELPERSSVGTLRRISNANRTDGGQAELCWVTEHAAQGIGAITRDA
jgi:hypothetical protein